MYVVCVDIDVAPTHWPVFLDAMKSNAAHSLAAEPGCRQFDVCVSDQNPSSVFLYEIYDDAAAFKAHLLSEHFLEFDREVTPWITKKTVRTLNRLAPF
jgi:(4S)-4-hydroxy-5-phosphonooxypentane-2,3-dione isomerase